MTATDTGSSSSSTPAVTPSGDTQTHLTSATNAIALVTAYANAIANIVLTANTDPPEAWFAPLDTALTSAQTHVTSWVDTLGPALSAKVPQTIIDYGNLFSAASSDILSVLQASNYNPDSAGRQEILGDLSAMLGFVSTQIQTITDLQTELKTFQDNLLADHKALALGAAGAQAQLDLDNTTIANIQAQIATITADLNTATQNATMSDIGIGLGIFIALVAVVAIVATGGAALPCLVAGVAVIGIGAGITESVINTPQIAEDQAKLTALNAELTTDQQQATALQAILNTTQTIVTANTAASAALDNIVTVWEDLLTKTTSVQTALQAADAAADGATFGAFAVKLYTKDAVTSWSELVAWCTNMQTALLGITVTTLQKAA